MNEIPLTSDVAFKEWAVVCAALAAGRQSIILRKGGIHEGPGGFRPEHDAFWLYPTSFHQGLESLAPGSEPFLQAALAAKPPAGQLYLQHLAIVEQVHELQREADALALEGQHLWSQVTVRQRFHYRRPGLYALLVRVYCSLHPHSLLESADFSGCKTWVPLPGELAIETPRPILTTESFALAAAALTRVVG